MRKIFLIAFLFIEFVLWSQTYIKPPYSTGFENGLGSEWTTNTTQPTSHIFINSSQTPKSGLKHLSFSGTAWWPQNYSLNSAMLHLDLDSAINVNLSFWIEDYVEENHSQNGIYLSDNGGNTFVKIMNYNGYSYEDDKYFYFNLDISALALQKGLSLTSNFIIKFQQYGYEPINSDGISIDDISITQETSLPVELISFKINQDDNKIRLNWQILTEVNNAYYTVESSIDCENWEEIGKVQSLGNSTTLQNYTFTDNNINTYITYYRLKQTDFDGKFAYLAQKSFKFIPLFNSNNLIFPNPCKEYLTISGYTNTEIIILNSIGQDISNQVEISNDSNQISLKVSKLRKGLYFLKLNNKLYKIIKD